MNDSTPTDTITGSKTARVTAATLLVAGGLVSAIGAASCCALPVLLGSLGLASAWLGNLAIIAGPHRPELLDLGQEVVEAHLAGADALFDLDRGLAVDDLLGALDQGEHVAHAEDPRRGPLGLEDLEVLRPLACAPKPDLLPGRHTQGQSRSTACAMPGGQSCLMVSRTVRDWRDTSEEPRGE